MKLIISSFIILAICMACKDNAEQLEAMQKRITSLELKTEHLYTPGFGEFMSVIQVHHNKLWFAGINSNWELADFEVGEIRETLQALEKFQSQRVETESLPIIYPALDSVASAIKNANPNEFRTSFTALTATCNKCHQAVKYSFNRVKIPDKPPFSNQVFKK